MSNKNKMSRRELFTKSLIVGGGAGLLTSSVGKAICGLTPQQTPGPFYPTAIKKDEQNDLTQILGSSKKASGQIIYISGTVTDEDCKAVPYAIVEIWQANKFGQYDHELQPPVTDKDFQYWGRAVTDGEGKYWFKTIKPGAYDIGGGRKRTQHIHVKVLRRGYRDLITQLYFEGEPLNATDGVLQSIPVSERSRVVIPFKKAPEQKGFDKDSQVGEFNIVLQKV